MELVIGRVAKSHGIRGEIVVEVRTDSPELRFADGVVLTGRRPREKQNQTYTVAASRNHSGRLLVRLQGVSDRTAADELRGTLFFIDSADVEPSDDPDEFYDHELEGLAVRTVDGADVGVIAEVLHAPGGELLSVKAADGREILIPFVTAIVPEIDIAGGVVLVDAPEGLLDPE
ncbi:ribosome maturation factor RimM [Tsukamurella spumae]|uniref:Ribosome maturation factor RimM n=1 Tax=Tsukamurella spumae TaxID=44753 RepID=A0A846X319_9ACTN|nr:ribosome maturation factor RimM [Tsukamurella spumae]NKY18915.1 ribosome maturation factor RimM [Tsukamurella spumae]